MNINSEKIDELNAVLTLSVSKDDYAEKVNKVIKDYRKKSNIKGFRPGKAPEGLIRKMYGKSVLLDEVNKLISESISNYIRDEKLKILGEPLPSENQEPIDFDNHEDFEFKFDIAVAPEIEVKLSKKDKVPYYSIKVDKDMQEKQTDHYLSKFGKFVDVEEVTSGEMIKGNIRQVDASEDKEPVIAEDVTISLEVMKDKEIKESFKGKKPGEEITFDLRKAYPSDVEISSMLKIEKEQAKDISGNFELEIKSIQKFEKAELNQELFDNAFGEGTIKTKEEFNKKIIEELKGSLEKESDYRFIFDAKDKLISKFKPKLPEAFLKRWLKAANEGKLTEEHIDNEFDAFLKDLQWQLIKDAIITENEIKVEPEEALEMAKELTKMQFQQYGMSYIPDEHLENYAQEIMKKDEERKKIYEKKFEDKVVDFVKDTVKLDKKEVSSDDFQKIWEKDSKKK